MKHDSSRELYRLSFRGAFETVEGAATYADFGCASEIAARLSAELAACEAPAFTSVDVVVWRDHESEETEEVCPACRRPLAPAETGVRALRRAV